MDYISYPKMGAFPDGRPCLLSQLVAFPRPAPAQQRVIADSEWRDYLASYPLCPFAPSPAADPQLIAIRASQTIPLPEPKPSIAPGWGLTGKTAYLETSGARQHHFGADTPLGPLNFDSVGRYYVDWGDGTKTGPYDFEGGPWPTGRITHDYRDVGTYDVVVREEWTSTWSVGGAGGVLYLRTEGRIDDFRVEQIQVVVTPG